VLPDPRSYGQPAARNPLIDLATHGAGRDLVLALRDMAAARRDDEIREALAGAGSRAVYAKLWGALCTAVEKAPAEGDVVTTVFAMPWVIVAAGNAAAKIDCVLTDAGELARVLGEHGAFGASRNVGLSNAMCAIEALETMHPSTVLDWSRDGSLRDIPPAPISVARGVEEVHLRFLIGAAVASIHAPDIVETAANIGTWGTPALRVVAKQLAVPDVQLLPMPRPPAGIYTAAYAGRRAAIEAAFNLFMSNSVRRIRMAVGDPELTLSAHAGGELRVTLSTPLDDSLVEGFRWPLHPADDLDEIEGTIARLAAECRLDEPHVVSSILPDRTPTGAALFPAMHGAR
jgi:hypothetical protein